MSFKIGEHGKIIEMFAKCPKCHISYLIIYEDGAKLCTYCGYNASKQRKNGENDECM